MCSEECSVQVPIADRDVKFSRTTGASGPPECTSDFTYSVNAL